MDCLIDSLILIGCGLVINPKLLGPYIASVVTSLCGLKNLGELVYIVLVSSKLEGFCLDSPLWTLSLQLRHTLPTSGFYMISLHHSSTLSCELFVNHLLLDSHTLRLSTTMRRKHSDSQRLYTVT